MSWPRLYKLSPSGTIGLMCPSVFWFREDQTPLHEGEHGGISGGGFRINFGTNQIANMVQVRISILRRVYCTAHTCETIIYWSTVPVLCCRIYSNYTWIGIFSPLNIFDSYFNETFTLIRGTLRLQIPVWNVLNFLKFDLNLICFETLLKLTVINWPISRCRCYISLFYLLGQIFNFVVGQFPRELEFHRRRSLQLSDIYRTQIEQCQPEQIFLKTFALHPPKGQDLGNCRWEARKSLQVQSSSLNMTTG